MARPPDLRHLDPEVRKERVKLLSNAVNALGVALMIGSLVAPFVDPARDVPLPRSALGVVVGAILVFAAFTLLRYMKRRE